MSIELKEKKNVRKKSIKKKIQCHTSKEIRKLDISVRTLF